MDLHLRCRRMQGVSKKGRELQQVGGVCSGFCDFAGLLDLLKGKPGRADCCVTILEVFELRVTFQADLGYVFPINDMLILLSTSGVSIYCAETKVVSYLDIDAQQELSKEPIRAMKNPLSTLTHGKGSLGFFVL